MARSNVVNTDHGASDAGLGWSFIFRRLLFPPKISTAFKTLENAKRGRIWSGDKFKMHQSSIQERICLSKSAGSINAHK